MKLHKIQGYIQNIFLAEYPDKLLLLDGCARADVNKVCDYITGQLGRPLGDLKLIVVTHMHPDHAGGAHVLRKRTGTQITSHPKAPDWYSGFFGRISHFIDIVLLQYVAHKIKKRKRWSWYPARLVPDFLVDDQEILPGFSDWQVLFTPGHTNHDLSILHLPTNQVYVADLLVKVKGKLHSPYPVCHPNQYRRSLERLKALDEPSILFAHLGKTILTDEEVDELILSAPEKPKNYWFTLRSRISGILPAHQP